MKHRRRFPFISPALRWLAVLVVSLAPATTALARSEESEPDIVDARLEGYKDSVTLPETSSGLTWFLFAILAVFVTGGLFKDAKRSHLD